MQSLEPIKVYRSNYFNIVGKQANLNDRLQRYLKAHQQLSTTSQGRPLYSPPNRKSGLEPLNQSQRKQVQLSNMIRNELDLITNEYYPTTQKVQPQLASSSVIERIKLKLVKTQKKLTPLSIQNKAVEDIQELKTDLETLKSLNYQTTIIDNQQIKARQQDTNTQRNIVRKKPEQIKDASYSSPKIGLQNPNKLEYKKIQHFMQFSQATFLQLIGKKDYYLDKMAKGVQKFYLIQTSSLNLTKEELTTITFLLEKVKKFLTNRARYKYRKQWNAQGMPQFQIINYNIRKREKQQSTKHQERFEEEKSSPQMKQKSNKPEITDFESWKRLNNIPQKQMVFIIKGGYHDLREKLVERGFYENEDVYSPFFDFKWTCKVQDIEYDRLKDYQIVNHFEQNQTLTSKYGLCRNIRTSCWTDKSDFNEFYPRCYDIQDSSDFQDFLEDFKMTLVINQNLYPNSVTESLALNSWNRLRIRLALQILKRNEVDFLSQMNQIVFHDQCPLIQKDEWTILKGDNQKKMDNELICNIQSNLVQEGLEDFEEQKEFQQKYTPIIVSELSKKQNNHQFTINGQKNIWIAKPDCIKHYILKNLVSSRGRGIKCFNNLNQILDYTILKENSFVVQKYIENPLLIKDRKFDIRLAQFIFYQIRQWVLVQELCPPKIWFFQECYIRFSAETFDLDNFNNRFAHLTNNSVAKYSDKFHQSEIKGNMWTQEQFSKYLKETTGQDIFAQKIQPKFKEIIIYTIKSTLDLMRHRTKSFEIFGYDFLIDLNYNTWLIEVNSSPTLEHSTSVTSNLVNHLVEDTLKVVLENPYKKNKTNAGYFNLIYPQVDKKLN